MTNKNLVWFNEVGKDDGNLVGGKGANMGEMVKIGLPIPPGFITTSNAYYYFIKSNNLEVKIDNLLKTCDPNNPKQLEEASVRIKKLINSSPVPKDLALEIIKAYEKLGSVFKQELVAVRSSATAEDLKDASFAGQQETFLNISGEANLLNKVRACWASLYTPRAIFYRHEKKYHHLKLGLAVIVQKMINATHSGIIFTVDPISKDKKTIVIEAIYGLGELIVQGTVTPDNYKIDKTNFHITNKLLGRQEIQLIKSNNKTKEVKVALGKQAKQKITDSEIVALAKLAKKTQQHYFYPQDMEWAIENKKIYLLQTRAITTLDIQNSKHDEITKINLPLILKGEPASPGIISGYPRILKSFKEIHKIKSGEILITTKTTPDFVPAMRKAGGIITDQGGQTSHAAIVSRELGVPCVVGTKQATKIIKEGAVITINGKTGEVYKGSFRSNSKSQAPNSKQTKNINFSNYKLKQRTIKTATKLYVNLADPDKAKEISQLDVDGVGLLRAEFIISAEIKYHPKKLIRDKNKAFFIDKLTSGLEKFCRAFYPRPVVYRTTDFKTNEYRNLIGGKAYEPKEENPLIGYRGAFRYQHDPEVFDLELEAIKKVRNKLNLKNLHLMLPFVRSPYELIQVKRILNSNGLYRSPSFQLWMMVEIPSNVILLNDFIKIGIDGVSIGSNDLTMLVLGVDRDNENLSHAFDERNPAVMWCIEETIKTCHKNGITCSLCGQAPSIYPDFTQKLVNFGITSISVTPDMIEQTREIIYEAEKRLVKNKC